MARMDALRMLMSSISSFVAHPTPHARPELLALMLGEFLGVVEQGIGVAIGKYNRSSAHRTCEAAAPGFVASGFEDECRGGCREDFGWAFHFALCLTLHRQNRIRDPTC